jgi:hypothetical protein
MGKKVPMPPEWDAARTPVATFVGFFLKIDLDGRELELTVVGGRADITDISGRVLWEGPAPDGPFCIDAVFFIVDKIKGDSNA